MGSQSDKKIAFSMQSMIYVLEAHNHFHPDWELRKKDFIHKCAIQARSIIDGTFDLEYKNGLDIYPNETYLTNNLPKIRLLAASPTYKKYICSSGGWHLGTFEEYQKCQPVYIGIAKGVVKALNKIATGIKVQGGEPIFAKITAAQIEAPEEQPKLPEKVEG
jgi:hypothetical protein